MLDFPFFAGRKPRIIGHRGAAGEAPENTLPSFQRALADGAGFVELDVHGTADGEAVVIHDETVDRTTDGSGAVKRLRARELKRLDAGYRFTRDGGATYPFRGRQIEIPTLAELFSFLPEIRVIVEIKPSNLSTVERVIETVRQAGKERDVLLATEDDRIMQKIRAELRKKDLPIATGFCYGEVAGFIGWLEDGTRASYRSPGQAMQLPCEYQGRTLVSAETVQAAHGIGVEMYVWTINDLDAMARLLSLGVDGIVTDYPGRLRALVGGGINDLSSRPQNK